MFSLFLLHKGNLKSPVPAASCNVRATVVGCSGLGRATLQFNITDHLKNALILVPALLCHKSGLRTNLRVTSCDARQGARPYQTLELAKNSWDKTIPESPYSYYQVKASLEKVACEYGVAGTQDDLLLHIGDLPEGTALTVNIGFVVTIEPVAGLATTDIILATLSPSSKVSINVDILPMGHVETLTPLTNTPASAITHTPLDQASLSVNLSSDFSPNVSSSPIGFSISLMCPGVLLSQSRSVLFSEPMEMRVEHRGDTLVVNGIQILSNILPPRDNSLSPSEFIFLVDCSCSMCGHKIQSAGEALLLAIKSLPVKCYFNVIAFGSKYRALFQTSVEVNDKSIDKASQFVTNLKACLGGTELLGPLRWLLRKPINAEVGTRQILLITDGSVPNIKPVLDTVTRHKQSTRVHSFALGPDICSELMAGVSSITRGHYVVVGEDDRLQTKVMEVMRKCLYAPLTTPLVTWSPPNGYSITSIVPSKLYSPLYGGSALSMFALLKKNEDTQDGGDTGGDSSRLPFATITGVLEKVPVEVQTTSLVIQTTPYDNMTALVLRVAAWRKLTSLHSQLLQPPPKPHPSQSDDDACPPAKKLRLNGHAVDPSHNMALEDLISISLSAKIPCFPYTIFVSSGDGLPVTPILPWNGPSANNTSISTDSKILSVKVPLRKRPKHDSSSLTLTSATFSTLARKTVTKFGEAVKSAVNIASLGLMDMDTSPTLNGEGLEDQEYYSNEKSRIHWNYNNELVVPSCYYTTSTPATGGSHDNRVNGRHDNQESRRESDDDSMCEEIFMDCNDLALSNRLYSQPTPASSTSTSTTPTCSTTANTVLLPPNYTSIVELQLPDGAWSLVPSIALATGIPMTQIQELPLQNGTSKDCPAPDKGHYWATVLVLACLEFHFGHFETEWLLLARKAKEWLVDKQTAAPMQLLEAHDVARRLVTKYHQ